MIHHATAPALWVAQLGAGAEGDGFVASAKPDLKPGLNAMDSRCCMLINTYIYITHIYICVRIYKYT